MKSDLPLGDYGMFRRMYELHRVFDSNHVLTSVGIHVYFVHKSSQSARFSGAGWTADENKAVLMFDESPNARR